MKYVDSVLGLVYNFRHIRRGEELQFAVMPPPSHDEACATSLLFTPTEVSNRQQFERTHMAWVLVPGLLLSCRDTA